MRWLLALLLIACSSEDMTNSRFRGVVVVSRRNELNAILLTGQSNAVGRGGTPPNVTDPASIPFWHWKFETSSNSTQLEPLTGLDGDGLVDGFHGAELVMAPTIRAAGRRVAVYRHGTDGACVHEWVATESHVTTTWTELESQLPKVNWLLETLGRPVRWHIVWNQGECNILAFTSQAQYAAHLRTVLAQLRAPSLCGPSAKAYLTEMSENFDVAFPAQRDVINAAIAEVAADPGNRFISTDGIAINPAGAHYDGAGQNELGSRYAQAILADL